MDNNLISIQSDSREDFNLAIKLLCKNKVTHFFDHPDKGLIAFWTEGKINEVPATPFPVPLAAEAFAEMAWQWLLAQPDSKYQEYLDHDGDNGKGFKVYNEVWGRIGGNFKTMFAVLPVWAWYGK